LPGESESTRDGKRRNETGWSKNRELVEPVRREENKPTKPVKPEEGWERDKKTGGMLLFTLLLLDRFETPAGSYL
jgi:hypothetical protein